MRKQSRTARRKKYVVFFDFDNTITLYDILDDMLKRFSKDNHWLMLEKKWERGEIGSRDCLNGQVSGLRVKRRGLDEYLKKVRIDPYFKKLISLLHIHKIKAFILSDSFDYILNCILKNNEIEGLNIYSNKLRFQKDRLVPDFPFLNKKCLFCGHCKAKNLLANTDKDSIIIYVGDGHSDICPAKYADIVFAKEDLLKHFKENNLYCLPYKSLGGVYRYFRRRLHGG